VASSGHIHQDVRRQDHREFVLSADGQRLIYKRSSGGRAWQLYAASLPMAQPPRPSACRTGTYAVAAEVDIRPAESIGWVAGAGRAKIQTFIRSRTHFDRAKNIR